MKEILLAIIGQGRRDFRQNRSRCGRQLRVAHVLDLGEAERQRFDLGPVECLGRQGVVLGQPVAIAALALDARSGRAQAVDIAIERAHGNARLLGEPRGRHRLGQGPHRLQKSQKSVRTRHGSTDGKWQLGSPIAGPSTASTQDPL